ncbi:MAG: repeat-associated core domain protein [Phycisphaerales bacterium]|nr:repeat-associated core domain protein [Phycisphaerales bacterium]
MDDLVLRDRTPDGSTTSRLYVQQDANYNVTAITDTSGAVQERFVYTPYGVETTLTSAWATGPSGFGQFSTDSNAWIYGFQGWRYDTGTGYYTVRNRDYDVVFGWVGADPTGGQYRDGANLYQMELSNPVNNNDPTGLLARTPFQYTGLGRLAGIAAAVATGYELGEFIYTSGAGNYILTTPAGNAIGATVGTWIYGTPGGPPLPLPGPRAPVGPSAPAPPPISGPMNSWCDGVDVGQSAGEALANWQFGGGKGSASPTAPPPAPAPTSPTPSPASGGSGSANPPPQGPATGGPSTQPSQPNSVIGKTPVKPGPNYNLDAGQPHPAVLGRDGQVYVGTMHGQAFNNAAAANGGTSGVIGSGEVIVDTNGNIVSSTIKPITGK